MRPMQAISSACSIRASSPSVTRCAPAKRRWNFAAIPTFSPEHFARIEQKDTMKRKQFVKGMEQIAQEGAIQIFREVGGGMEEVVVGVVGVLQLEVLEYRLNTEYNVEIRMQQLPFEQLRWVKNDPDTYNLRDLDLTSDTQGRGGYEGQPSAAVHLGLGHPLGRDPQRDAGTERVRQHLKRSQRAAVRGGTPNSSSFLDRKKKITTKNARNGMRQAPNGEHFWHGGK